MPGKSQSHTDAVLNVLRGIARRRSRAVRRPVLRGPRRRRVGWHGVGRERLPAAGDHVRRSGNGRRERPEGLEHEHDPVRAGARELVAGCGVRRLRRAEHGNLLYWDTLPTPKTVQQDDYGQFGVGTLIVKED